jgi:hypothetical protein
MLKHSILIVNIFFLTIISTNILLCQTPSKKDRHSLSQADRSAFDQASRLSEEGIFHESARVWKGLVDEYGSDIPTVNDNELVKYELKMDTFDPGFYLYPRYYNTPESELWNTVLDIVQDMVFEVEDYMEYVYDESADRIRAAAIEQKILRDFLSEESLFFI